MENPIYLLVDNGSLQPDSVISLHQIAIRLSNTCSTEIIPVSLLHSNKIPASHLNGFKAQTIVGFLKSEKGQNAQSLVIIPFFIGPSRGITNWLKDKLEEWKNNKVGRSFKILECLYSMGDSRLAEALHVETKKVIMEYRINKPNVVLVDHGTPVAEVNEVREQVGIQFFKLLKGSCSECLTSSMERREGAEYDFNEPLIENVLHEWGTLGITEVVVSFLFLLPGRHAGKGGDLDRIFDSARKEFPNMNIRATKPIGSSEFILKILCDRIEKFKKV